MISDTDNPVGEATVLDIGPAETNDGTFFTAAFFFQCLGVVCNLAGGLVAPLGRLWTNYYPRGAFGVLCNLACCLVAPLGRLWTNYYPRGAFGEEAVIMPSSELSFIITGLLAFAEIKSQGQAEFPFQSHPQVMMVSVTSLLMYGLASAAELVISAARLDPTSVYAIIARLGRMGSLCVLVGSLASLFYF